MKIAVVYDSYYGNNKHIAQTIASGFSSDVTLSHVQDCTIEEHYDLLVLGCPTRAMRPTKPMMNFIKNIQVDTVKRIAIYDTRMQEDKLPKFLVWMMKRFGHAVEKMDKTLRKKNPNWVIDTNYFEVVDAEGPLGEGQLQKATEWSATLEDALSK